MLNPLLCFLCILNYVQLFLIHHNRLFIIYFWVDPLFCAFICGSAILSNFSDTPKHLNNYSEGCPISNEISIVELWYFYGFSKAWLWHFIWVPVRFQRDVYGMSMGLKRDFFGNPIGFPWYLYWISMIFLWDYYISKFRRIPLAFDTDFCGILQYFHGIPKGFLFFHDVSIKLLYIMPMVFLWDLFRIPEGFPWYFFWVPRKNVHFISLGFLDFHEIAIWVSM